MSEDTHRFLDDDEEFTNDYVAKCADCELQVATKTQAELNQVIRDLNQGLCEEPLGHTMFRVKPSHEVYLGP